MNNLFEIPKSENRGIYAIYNFDKFKMYIGQTNNFKKRAMFHNLALLKHNHSNKGLQSDCNDRLKFIIFYNAEKFDNLFYLEDLYIIQALKMGINLYNIPPKKCSDALRYYQDKFVENILLDFKTQKNINNTFISNIGLYPATLKYNFESINKQISGD